MSKKYLHWDLKEKGLENYAKYLEDSLTILFEPSSLKLTLFIYLIPIKSCQ